MKAEVSDRAFVVEETFPRFRRSSSGGSPTFPRVVATARHRSTNSSTRSASTWSRSCAKGKTSEKRRAIEQADDFVELVKWRTGAEGRIAALKRQHGWDRARIRGLAGARIWCGWGVFNHNATKVAALTI